MFGNFDIVWRGRSILGDSGGSPRVMALLKFMLAQPGKALTAEAIAQNVWPENEYQDEKKVVRTYVHRLRRFLKEENAARRDFTADIGIASQSGGYIAELSPDAALDTAEFERIKDLTLGALDQPAMLAAFARVNGVYGGEFLPECRYDHWAIMLRNYYLRAYCTVTLRVIAVLERAGNWPAILDVCEKSLKMAELDEGINVAFLGALVETGQSAAALKHYSYLTGKLYTELSAVPSEKLREVYARAKASRKREDSFAVMGDVSPETIDKQAVYNMLTEIVKVYVEADNNRYSIATAEVRKIGEMGEIIEYGGTNAEKSDIAESLRYALEYALRRGDMYAILRERYGAVVVLADAKPEFYRNIENRISNAFYSRYQGYAYKIFISVSPVTMVR
jgi:DNA-binding SARP family transcriptional activator